MQEYSFQKIHIEWTWNYTVWTACPCSDCNSDHWNIITLWGIHLAVILLLSIASCFETQSLIVLCGTRKILAAFCCIRGQLVVIFMAFDNEYWNTIVVKTIVVKEDKTCIFCCWLQECSTYWNRFGFSSFQSFIFFSFGSPGCRGSCSLAVSLVSPAINRESLPITVMCPSCR